MQYKKEVKSMIEAACSYLKSKTSVDEIDKGPTSSSSGVEENAWEGKQIHFLTHDFVNFRPEQLSLAVRW